MTPLDTLKAYEAKINLHDFDEVAPLISGEAVFWFSEGTHCGHDEIRGAFERTWRDLRNETYWLEDLDWVAVSDGAAACTYRFHWIADVDGRISGGTGRGTTVLRREGSVWKIAHEHLSLDPNQFSNI